MSRALNERGEQTALGKAALAKAYPDLCERLGATSQGAIGKALGGFTQAAVSKFKNGEAGRPMAEAAARVLGLDLEGLVAKYSPDAPELLRFRDPRYPNLERAASMAISDLDVTLAEVFQERGQRDNDARVEEWLRVIRGRHDRRGRPPKTPGGQRPDVGGRIDRPWKDPPK